MKLLFDIGNTRIKWAIADAQGIHEQHSLPHADVAAGIWPAEWWRLPVKRVLVANVAGATVAESLRAAVRAHWPLQAEFATSVSEQAGVRNAYAQPATLGVDRWLALLGAYAMAPRAALVVDVGTALTLDALTAEGEHLGGLIVPGPALMMQSLMKSTSDIASFSMNGHETEEFFADNTLGCVQQGALRATAAVIDAAYVRLARQLGTTPRLLLAGGAAESIEHLLTMPVQPVPDLVLRGLLVALPD